MDTNSQRTLADRIAAAHFDKNGDGKLTARERLAAVSEHLGKVFLRAFSLSPPDRIEIDALAGATPDSVTARFSNFAKQNAALYPNGIEAISPQQAAEIADASRQIAAAIRQLPEPNFLAKLEGSATLRYWEATEFIDVELPLRAEDLLTSNAPTRTQVTDGDCKAP